ncbi:hypothetical protein OBBRIDRAFT_788704 [Obba rivulosa]|uniref:HMA domain-containing protein n=1 Tax=Obba rivulosa TaxID=1052685 RepID=A0A8E2DSH1_9APHY|nr:hypothetical protein OBBRIDRAFT_788704 [Obba rivulosa]
MTCSGCSGAVERVLKKTEGVASYDVSLEKQEVLVKGTIPYDDLLEKIKKTGKEVRCHGLDFPSVFMARAAGPLGRRCRVNEGLQHIGIPGFLRMKPC